MKDSFKTLFPSGALIDVHIIIILLLLIGIGSMESFFSPSSTNNNDVIKMKIISEPLTNFASNHLAAVNQDDDDDENIPFLSPLVAPSNFSGPAHFRSLLGRCFTLQKGNFEYRLCPFANATQKETAYSVGRSRYHGIIGIWHDWIIDDGSFAGWRFLNGDSCGGKGLRMTTVNFACGNNNLLWEASEPEQCEYTMTLKLPQACYLDSLLVYPTLSDKTRLDWDKLEGEKLAGEITSQGYEKYLRELFITTGLVKENDSLLPGLRSPETSEPIITSTDHLSGAKNKASVSKFTNLEQCQKAYDETTKHLQQLETNCQSQTPLSLEKLSTPASSVQKTNVPSQIVPNV